MIFLTFELKSLILVFKDITVDLHTGFSDAKAALLLLIRERTSELVPPFSLVDSKVIPCQLLQSAVSPFFGSLTIKPSYQSRGNLSVSQIYLNRGYSMSVLVEISALSSSAATLSEPAALLFLSSLMATLISLGVGPSAFIGSSIGFGLNLRGFLGASLLRMHAKRSARRANCRSLSVIVSPLVFYTGLGCRRVLPLSFLVIL